MYPYTHDEIKAYVKSHLMLDLNSREWVDTSRKQLVSTIAQLPAWKQVLLVERGIIHVAGGYEFINKHGNAGRKEPLNINGFFGRGTRSYGKATITNGIFYVAGAGMERTIRHEQGHLVDAILGDAFNYFSDLTKAWAGAVDSDLKYRKAHFDGKVLDAKSGIDNDIDDEAANDVTDPEMSYPHYRTLHSHLSLYEDESAHAKEAFAEISTHYDSLYAKTGGDEAAIDRIMYRNYPDQWAIYKSEILEQGKLYAEGLLMERQMRISEYIIKAENIYADAGLALNEDKAKARIRLALAAGFDDNAMDDLDFLREFFKNPAEQYTLLKKPNDKLAPIDADTPYELLIDDNNASDAMARTIETRNIHTGVEKYLKGLRDARAADIFFDAFEDLSHVKGGGEDAVSAFAEMFPDESPSRVFKDIYENGGIAAIHLFRACVPNKDAVIQYKEALENFAMARAKYDKSFDIDGYMQGPLQGDLSIAIRENMRDPFAPHLRQAAIPLKTKLYTLESYARKYADLAKKVAGVAGLPDAQVLMGKCYNHFIRDGQAPSHVSTFGDITVTSPGVNTKRLDVSMQGIKEYVSARRQFGMMRQFLLERREELSWSKNGDIYRVSLRGHKFSQQDMEEIAEDAMRIIAQDGRGGLRVQINNLAGQVSSMIERYIEQEKMMTRGVSPIINRTLSIVFQSANSGVLKQDMPQDAEPVALMIAPKPAP